MKNVTEDLAGGGDVYQKGLDAMETLCGGGHGTVPAGGEMGAKGLGGGLSWLLQVIRGLVGGGVGVKDAFSWVTIIFQLLTTLGPKIQDIIKLIRDAIGQGKTPDTFDVQAAVSQQQAA